MTTYELILNGLKEFYSVNDVLRADLEKYSKENTGRTLDHNIELYAKKYSSTKYVQQIIDELNDLNADPHCISEMETMYELIDDFSLMEV